MTHPAAPPVPPPATPLAPPARDLAAAGAALLDAARAGDLAAARDVLVAHPAAALARDAAGESAFVVAAFRGHRAVATAIAEARAALRSATDHGAGPGASDSGAALDVFEAAIAGDVARLAELLDDDPALAHAVRPDGWPALHLTGFWGMPAAAALLVDRGADVRAVSRNATANTALHATLAISQDLATARVLLDRGADARARGAAGWTPLHLAASRGNVEAIALLLAHGADPAATSDDGKRPADLARERGHGEAAARLGG